MSATELKPCPFCGRNDWRLIDDCQALTHDDECHLRINMEDDETVVCVASKWDVEAWNRRDGVDSISETTATLPYPTPFIAACPKCGGKSIWNYMQRCVVQAGKEGVVETLAWCEACGQVEQPKGGVDSVVVGSGTEMP